MKISYSNVRGHEKNTSYPYVIDIHSAEELAKAAAYDNVCAVYDDGYNQRKRFIRGYRSNKTFNHSDCLPMDCDNSSNDPLIGDIPETEWKTPADVAKAFPDVEFYVVYSRNNMKEKNGKAARPKFHVYFPMSMEISDWKKYNVLKQKVYAKFPVFDNKALDAARFFFGVENPKVEHYSGNLMIDEYINRHETEIVEGARNSTMSHFAGMVLKKFGDSDGKAYAAFIEKSRHCVPPLENEELDSIWRSALGFYENTIKSDDNYISPTEYNSIEFSDNLIPADYTDIGQANAFMKEYGKNVAYATGVGLLYYTGAVWKEDKRLVRRAIQGFTQRQLALAWRMVNEAETDADEEKAEAFFKFVLSRRKSSNITAVMNELEPMAAIDVKCLDADGMLLNTPSGTVDLRTGEMRKHDPEDMCTKITTVAPSDDGKEEFEEFLDKFTCGDTDLRRYLQIESGMEIIGGVYSENAVIQTGTGGNGKSTYNNAKHMVLGDYAGTIPADLLTMSYKKSKGPEYAELRGKRFILAAELQEGMRLDTAALKNLCSTDPIRAEKKFEAPFDFIPTHTTVLYTNHLPKVGTVDKGTWDRIIVVPLSANFRGSGDEIKNYGEVLYKHCGGAILKWMIEGARMYIENGFKIEPPKCVKDAVAEYREENDWLTHFTDECCDTGKSYTQKAGELYETYRAYCDRTGEYKRSSSDFKSALSSKGFECRRVSKGFVWFGIKLNEDNKIDF